jgi:hypothetical protein
MGFNILSSYQPIKISILSRMWSILWVYAILCSQVYQYSSAVDPNKPRLRKLVDARGQSIKQNITDTEQTIKGKAIALCSSSSTLNNAIYGAEQIRNVWNSTIPVYIVHCDEIDPHMLDATNMANVSLFNICEDHLSLAKRYSRDVLRRRLRSWWCKAAAIITIPHEEVMVVDLDVIWFNYPDLLFQTKGYKETGTLFFRDRVAKDNRQMQSKIEALIMREAPYLNITSPEVAKYKLMHHHHNLSGDSSANDESGLSFFFNTILDKNAPALTNHQDSSVLLVHRSRHPRLLQVLSNLILEFNIGWGDKELYWVSAIISDEPFAFEPFLIGSYGDCGYMIHYNPQQANEPDLSKIRPFYINAEWLINKVSVVGRDLEYMMSTPQLVRKNMTLHDIGAAHGCTFRFHGWVEVPFSTNQYILRALWERLSRSFRHRMVDVGSSEADMIDYYQKQCIPVYTASTIQLSVMVNNELIKNSLCSTYGCPHVPIPIDNDILAQHVSILCIPITFDFNPAPFQYTTTKSPYLGDNCSTITTPMARTQQMRPQESALYKATIGLQATRTFKANELIRFSSNKLVYLVKSDGKLHGFPNLQTFVSMGFDFSNVIVLDDKYYRDKMIGDMLPSV